jgi:hypothetical protein
MSACFRSGFTELHIGHWYDMAIGISGAFGIDG